MAEEEIKEGIKTEGDSTSTGDNLADLKSFLGTSYKEGMSLEEVSAFLKGKKFADLNSGNYVAKHKYSDMEKSFNDYKESTKDYDAIKTENENYKAAERKANLTKQATASNIDEQFIEFALSQIDPNEKDTGKALKEWAKAHPQFLKDERKIYIDTNPSHERGGSPKKSMSQLINDNIRAAVGRKE